MPVGKILQKQRIPRNRLIHLREEVGEVAEVVAVVVVVAEEAEVTVVAVVAVAAESSLFKYCLLLRI